MPQIEALQVCDAAVVARFLQLRSLIHDHYLTRIERLILERFAVQPIKRLAPTLVCDLRAGFLRPGEGEMWPVVFMTTVDISLALCVEISPERLANLGTVINGPQRIRHRNWESAWGWERPISQLRPDFFALPAPDQEDAVIAWYCEGLDWLAGSGLLKRKA